MPTSANQWVPVPTRPKGPYFHPEISLHAIPKITFMRIPNPFFIVARFPIPLIIIISVTASCSKSGSPSGPSGPTGPTSPSTPSTPTIASVAPDSGAYNTTVTITGTNFSTTTSSDIVSFNGTPATVSAATTTQLTVSVPPGAGTGVIKLTIGSNTITGPAFNYLYTYTVSTLISGSPAQFNDPFGLAVDTAGNIIVADDGNNKIKMVTPAGVVTTIAGNGTPGFNNGPSTGAEFLDPPSVAVDKNNNVFVADPFNYKIRELSGGTVSTVAGTSVGETNGPVSTAQFDSPAWLTVDSAGNIFVCDAHYIREISGGTVSTLYDGHNYTSTLVEFTGVALKPADTLILLDDLGANILQLAPGGSVTSIAGTGSAGYFDGPAATAQFSDATGIAIDASGNILVADEANQRIRKITPAGVVSTIAGSGMAADVDSTGTAAGFNYPHGIAVDKKSGAIYVLEPSTNRIRKITVK